MSTERIKIPRTSDRTVERVFRALGTKYAVQQAHVTALGFSPIGAVSLVAEPAEDWKVLLEHDSYLIESMHLQVAGMTVVFARGGQYPPEGKSPIFDEIVFNQNSQQPGTNKDRLDIVAVINREFRPFEPDRVITGAPTVEQGQLLAMHQSTLERLERLNEDLIRQGTEFRRSLEVQFDERVKESEQQFHGRQTELDEKHKARSGELDAQRHTLEEKLRLIDDRDNTHARREIRDKMLEDVKQRVSQFGVSASTERKRQPVLGGIFALIATFALLLAWTAYEISTMDRQYFGMLEAIRTMSSLGTEKLKGVGLTPELVARLTATDVDRTHLYWLWIRFTFFSLGFVATLLYYIRWQNKWAEQHSGNEFQLRQFQIDVSRANWVIESCLEWRKNTESVIPAELLSSITKNLFVSSYSEPEQVVHPADQLASALLGSASKVKLKVGENELDFDKPRKIPNKS